ncbi:MAG TPA: alpha/beta hydrolase [Dehalococcoidia bacterium]|nr:alpha/beta hydrolase [Dehalococcoidia bacterium]
MTERLDDLELRILQVLGSPTEAENTFQIRLETSRGPLECMFYAVEGGTGAAVFVGGAMGGIDGPANGLYSRLPAALAENGVSSLRIEYRQPNEFDECVLDVLGGCSFLKGVGATDVVLVGHSFGGAVVIKACELSPMARAVASLSPQLFGTRTVENLESPLLLVHGAADSVLASDASENIYSRANDPKHFVHIADTGHSLGGASDQLEALLSEWIPARLTGEPMESGRTDWYQDPEREA